MTRGSSKPTFTAFRLRTASRKPSLVGRFIAVSGIALAGYGYG
ncbi:hypothetical protein [Streptomyces sp. NPDC050564]